MVSGTISFLAGLVGLLWLPSPPPLGGLVVAPAVFWLARVRWGRPVAWALAGALWALVAVHGSLSARLPAELDGADVVVRATILDLPRPVPGGARFRARVVTLGNGGSWSGRVRLSWYGDPPTLRPGQIWSLEVRLKIPRGLLNPGGMDYEAHMFRSGFAATGYVRLRATAPRLISTGPGGVAGVRGTVDGRVQHALADHPMAGPVRALTVGYRAGMGPAHWEVLRATGTTHLMAISGLHVGMVAGLAFALARRVWPWPASIATPRAAAVVALGAAAAYAALSGFALPAQRALAMSGGFLLAVIMGRPVVSSHNLALSLLAVLLADPFAPLSSGFWLSFAAVAVILLAATGRLRPAGGAWRRWGQVHLVVAVGLTPVVLWSFGENPIVAPLANAIAVPWVGAVVVPMALAGTALVVPLPALGGGVLTLAAEALEIVWWLLQVLSEGGWVYRVRPPWPAVAAAMVGVALLLGPRGLGVGMAGLLWLIPVLEPAPNPPGDGVARATVLDVGQGLAVVVRTRHRTLVYDTGPPLGPGFDATRAAVIPFLERAGVQRVDTLVVSHADSDHSGGARSLLEAMPVGRVFGPPEVPGAQPCLRGLAWDWDGVRFRVLHPGRGETWTDNSGSCVVHVATQGAALLLPGDLEAVAERWVATRQGDRLAAEVLVAGHHGSGTSTTEVFLRRVRPQYAVFATGYRNRWGFPAPEVVGRLVRRGVTLTNTARCGAVTFALGPAGVVGPECWRHRATRLWHAPRP